MSTNFISEERRLARNAAVYRHRSKNIDKIRARERLRYKLNGGAAKKKAFRRRVDYYQKYYKHYQEANRSKINARLRVYSRNRLATDVNYKIKKNLRNRIRKALMGVSKSAKTCALLGCPVDVLIARLESLFQPGMTWDNYGKWHIDHIKPCASFDLTKEGEQEICFNFKNLQPLWAVDNIKKGAK